MSKNHKVKRISDEDWQEILDEVNMDFFPVEYLNSIIIKFENGTVWDIDINGSRKTHTLEDIEDTLDELFEAVTLIQTKKIGKFPIILVGTEFWSGLLDWIKTVMIDKMKNANPEDMNLIKVVDTEDEVLEALDNFYKKYNLSPNF